MATRTRSSLFATKPVDKLVADTKEGTTLNRAVGLLDLTALGIGAIIGTGIFVILGEVVGDAGPAIILSLRPRRRHVRVLGALLRRAGLDDPGLRQRLHVRLRHDGRAGRLDHRLGPDPRVRRVGGGDRRRLGPVLQQPARRRCSASRCRTRSPTRRARAARSTCRPCSSCSPSPALLIVRRARERAREHDHGDHQAGDRRRCSSSSRSRGSTPTTCIRSRRTASTASSTARRS